MLFDPQGRRLLISSVGRSGFRGEVRGTTVWDNVATTSARDRASRASGPLAFRPDGAPVPSYARRPIVPRSLRLWDVGGSEVVADFANPSPEKHGANQKHWAGAAVDDFAMSIDGGLIAASIKDQDGKFVVLVWDGTTGRQLRANCGACAGHGLFA